MLYRAITDENFYFLDIRRVAKEIAAKGEIKDLRKHIIENNLLEYVSENNLKNKLTSIIKRFEKLDTYLIKTLAEGDSETGKFINLYSILLNERIFTDFMYEIIRGKYLLQDIEISKNEYLNFINVKSEEQEAVKKWSLITKKKMAGKLNTFLREAGYITDGKITRPVITKDIRTYIVELGNKRILECLLYDD